MFWELPGNAVVVLLAYQRDTVAIVDSRSEAVRRLQCGDIMCERRRDGAFHFGEVVPQADTDGIPGERLRDECSGLVL